MGKNILKSISENLSGKYCQNVLDHAKQSPIDAIKTSSKRVIQNKKKREATGDLIGNKTAHRMTKLSISSETNKNEHDK